MELSTKYKGKALYIEFGGANTTAKVFVNGFFAGKHDGGYSAFRINITNYLRYDRKSQIAVLVDNSPTNYIAAESTSHHIILHQTAQTLMY